MLKNYFAIRIFVMLDIAGITLYAIALVNGWPLLHVLVLPSAIIWGALSVPLAGLFVFSVYHRLMLLQRKHTHVQYMYEQQQEILLQQQRQGLLSPSPQNAAPPQIMLEEDDLSQQSQSGVPMLSGVPLSQSVPRGTAATPDDFNVTVAMYLSQYPHASIREVERATGIPKSTIGRTLAWQNRVR